MIRANFFVRIAQNALAHFPLTTLISLLYAIFLIALIWGFYVNKVAEFLAILCVFLALALDCAINLAWRFVARFTQRFKGFARFAPQFQARFAQISQKFDSRFQARFARFAFIARFAIKCAIFAIFAKIICLFLMPLFDSFQNVFWVYYGALCAIFVLVFLACECFDFSRLYNAVVLAFILGGFYALLALCAFIFYLLLNYLFALDFAIFQTVAFVVLGYAFFIAFLGQIRWFCAKDSLTFSIIFQTLYCFAIAYIALIFVYFALQIFGIKNSQNVAHLVLLQSFFFLLLLWIKNAFAPKRHTLALFVLLLLDFIALHGILTRIAEYGFTPNRYCILAGCAILLCAIVFTLLGRFALVKTFCTSIFIIAILVFGGRFSAINLSINSQISEFQSALNAKNTERAIKIIEFLEKFMDKKSLESLHDRLDSH